MSTELETIWSQVVDGLREALAAVVRPGGKEAQGAFAKRAGVSRPVVNSFVNGKKTPEPDGLGRIAEALGWRASSVIGIVDDRSVVGSVPPAAVSLGNFSG